jgi:hypothetical protein
MSLSLAPPLNELFLQGEQKTYVQRLVAAIRTQNGTRAIDTHQCISWPPAVHYTCGGGASEGDVKIEYQPNVAESQGCDCDCDHGPYCTDKASARVRARDHLGDFEVAVRAQVREHPELECSEQWVRRAVEPAKDPLSNRARRRAK